MPSVKPPRRPAIARPLAGVALLGFAYGALGYGVPIAVLHILHNALGSLRSAAVLGVALALIYGAAAAALVAAGAAPVLLLQRARATPSGGGERDSDFGADPWSLPGELRDPQLAGTPLRVGLCLYGLAFWVPYFLWGLTYDQTVGPELRSAPLMAAYLLGAALLIAVGVCVASWYLGLGLRLCERNGRLGAVLGLGVVLAVLALVLATRAAPAGPLQPAPRASAAPADAAEAAVPPIAVDAAGVKIALVALDGLDPKVVDRLVREGALPTFERLRREGVYGPLDTLPDSNSAVLWASIYTGLAPAQHGILDFYRVHLAGL
ncbi:MAG TPA: alkaline phosphatase family protein, partial [Thermoanaerobaculia bacterium]|nr:alkaline phosphatase family protein [Thermoanaerobaculia bacterium]